MIRSASDGRYKLIQDLGAGTFSLFDLAGDPAEKSDVLRQERRAFFRQRPVDHLHRDARRLRGDDPAEQQ